MKLKFALLLAFPLLLSTASAAQPASAPATPATSTSVFVVAPEDLPKPGSAVAIDTPQMPEPEPAKASRPVTAKDVWGGPVPLSGILWILVASMPALASSYFAYQLYLFIQRRRRRLSTRHADT